MESAEHDIFPAYDQQDMEAFAVLMIHRAASRLGLTTGSDMETEMRNRVDQVAPGTSAGIDEIMELYHQWTDGKNRGASEEALRAIRDKIEERRIALSAKINTYQGQKKSN